ncbi:MAG: killer suppression protein [Chloroflexi bacterium]|nr:MAG: killer suppression protein [Chloroflexota bacterium]
MIVKFQNPKFQKECNNTRKLQKRQGDRRAKKIRQRLDDLKAAETLKTMKFLPGRCHELRGDRNGQLSLDLDHPWRLIFVPDDDPPALKDDDGIDWQNVKTVKIIGIEDTHE